VGRSLAPPPMVLYLLDSDAVIDFLVDFPPTVQMLGSMLMGDDDLCVCSVVLAEVFSGLTEGEAVQANDVLSKCLFLPTSERAARRAGEWRFFYRRQGRQLQTTDVLIAATAIQHEATLVTGNIRDYPMDGVKLLPLPRPGRPSQR
jgi:predicted nucleic acid-binding protein